MGWVDPLRLEQVVSNLIDNAIKYSPDGGPIEIELNQADNTIGLSVTDRGLGIAPEHRDGLFKRFYQAHEGKYYGGLGIGLYISRQIIELHGGEIYAEFPPNGGSRFVVALPANSEQANDTVSV